MLRPVQGHHVSITVNATLSGSLGQVARASEDEVWMKPVSLEMLQAMEEAAGPNPSLSDVRLLAVCLVAFASFLRCDELIKLRCKDVSFNEQGMVINIVSSKTDQYKGRGIPCYCTYWHTHMPCEYDAEIFQHGRFVSYIRQVI